MDIKKQKKEADRTKKANPSKWLTEQKEKCKKDLGVNYDHAQLVYKRTLTPLSYKIHEWVYSLQQEEAKDSLNLQTLLRELMLGLAKFRADFNTPLEVKNVNVTSLLSHELRTLPVNWMSNLPKDPSFDELLHQELHALDL